MKHSELVGLKDERLRILAPDATHQHFKGGLYRLLGIARDSDTGEPILGKDGQPRISYMHCYPYERQIWLRDRTEFFGSVDFNGETNYMPRFRKIQGTV